MSGESVRVGVVHGADLSDEQRAAVTVAEESFTVETVPTASGFDGLDQYDVLWWHSARPVEEVSRDEATAIEAYLARGGGLLLSLGALTAVESLGIDPVAPNVVDEVPVTEPTGFLWKSLYADHPAVASFEGLRVPVVDRGTVPVARYEGRVPERGEVLASTVRGDLDLPREQSVVSWRVGDGAVIGVGGPLVFDAPAAAPLLEHRATLLDGLLSALVEQPSATPGRPTSGEELARLRSPLADDPQRPRYHLTSPANWLNDPNGLIVWNDQYHVFYQYNPGGPFHETLHWGHAVSDDLVTWRDEPVALSPTLDGPDRDGCWSGCAVDDDGTPTILYTGGNGRRQLPCLATTDDPGLRSWQKHADNPIIEEPPAELAILETEHWEAEFRDHCVWRANGCWHQIIGSGVEDVGGAALLYRSEDLRSWEYVGPILVGDWEKSGTVWECPELLDLGEKQLLHVSNYEDVLYFLGELRDDDFVTESRDLLDHGDFYAPQSMVDGDRYLLWGWLPEARDVSAQWDAGWSGALSLPREIDLGPDGRLRQRPARELTRLREDTFLREASRELTAGQEWDLGRGRYLELTATVGLVDADAVELVAFASPDGEEETRVRYTAESELVVDRHDASADPEATSDAQRMPITPYDDPLQLRAFFDGSVVELFANERHCLTSRVYPTRADSEGLSLRARGGRASVSSLSVWQLGSMWA